MCMSQLHMVKAVANAVEKVSQKKKEDLEVHLREEMNSKLAKLI